MDPEKNKFRKFSFANLFSISRLIVILLILVLVVLVLTLIKSPFSKPGTYIDLSRDSVVTQMQSLGRLETASFTIEKIVEAGQQGNVIQNLLYGDHLLLIANGKVIAGVDLSKLTKDDVSVSGKTLTLDLPSPQIFSSNLDSSKTEVYDRTRGLLSQGNKDLESQARKSAEDSITKAACGSGILEEARKNAIERVQQLFKFSGFENVVVNIPSGSC